ncbi:transglutaminase TgpA family protein [Paenibacillus barcinonensis]|uniref:transglutaminase TgpA family protein n=1 Tax=Paenibacillus barcinonensis TaxID=198119 RepID=UPI001ABF496B|nr:transglutaminase domain-containing protein [Paenibacillus barcinonensis]
MEAETAASAKRANRHDDMEVISPLSSSVHGTAPVLYLWLITAGLLALCMEWIYPVISSGQTGSERFAAVMAGYSAVLLSVGLFRIGWAASIVIRIPMIYVALCLMYGASHPTEWGIAYPGLLNADLGEWIDKGRFRVMSRETRGLFMLCGWSMLLASVQYLLLLRRSIALFGTGTLVYLILLESLVGYEAYGSVVRSVCWLLFIQGLLYLLRLSEGTGHAAAVRDGAMREGQGMHGDVHGRTHLKKERSEKNSSCPMRSRVGMAWVAVSIGSTVCLVLISMLPARMNAVSPAGHVSVMDTVERLAKWAGYTPSGSVPASLNVTGYSTADAPMGAPLVQGNEPVFTASTPVSTYWRGETRSYYNGSTWSDVEQRFHYTDSSGVLRSDGWEEHPYWKRVRQIITMEREWRGPNPLFAGGLPVSLSFQDGNVLNSKNEKRLLSSEDTGTLWLASGRNREERVQNYTVDVMVPDVTAEVLRRSAGMVRMKNAGIDRTKNEGLDKIYVSGNEKHAGLRGNKTVDAKAQQTASMNYGQSMDYDEAKRAGSEKWDGSVEEQQHAGVNENEDIMLAATSSVGSDNKQSRNDDARRAGSERWSESQKEQYHDGLNEDMRIEFANISSASMDGKSVDLSVQEGSGGNKVNETDPASIRRKDLQLPDTLPKRVKDLAAEIMGTSATRYDAVQAVRSYLKANARYSLDTRMPPRGRDFVDDFLFVTRAGYCNHFSTAMVVLLRAEGIPARWVKGYAPGQADPQVPGRVIVTQADAHSWVEVYFPGVGWMPFEATPGFDAAQAVDASAAVAAGLQPGEGSPLPSAGSGLDRAGAWLAARARDVAAAPWPAAALAAAAMLCAAAWACALRLRPALRLRLLLAWPRSSFPDRERLLQAAAPVWHALARRYGPRPPGMTLREYAASPAVAAGTDGADIARFAADWERLLYGPDRPLRADSVDFLRRALRLTRRSPGRQR